MKNQKKILTEKQEQSINKKMISIATVLVVIIATKYIASDLIAPILLAGMFTVLLMPIFYFYRRRGVKPTLSLILMVATVILGAAAVIIAVQYSFEKIQESISVAMDNLRALTESDTTGVISETAKQATKFVTPEMAAQMIGRVLSSLSGLMFYFILIPVLAVLLVAQIDSLSTQFKDELTKSGPSIRRYRKFADSINSYIIGRFKVNLVTALMVTPALILFGVEYSVMWGLLTLVLSFIPYIGIFIAGAGPVLLVLATGGVPAAVLLIIVYVIITTITENFVDPLVQGKQNRLTTTSLIIGFIFWSWLFGIFGTILSAPLTVMLKSILEDYKETQWIAMLMVGDYSNAVKKQDSGDGILSRIKNQIPIIGKKESQTKKTTAKKSS